MQGYIAVVGCDECIVQDYTQSIEIVFGVSLGQTDFGILVGGHRLGVLVGVDWSRPEVAVAHGGVRHRARIEVGLRDVVTRGAGDGGARGEGRGRRAGLGRRLVVGDGEWSGQCHVAGVGQVEAVPITSPTAS